MFNALVCQRVNIFFSLSRNRPWVILDPKGLSFGCTVTFPLFGTFYTEMRYMHVEYMDQQSILYKTDPADSVKFAIIVCIKWNSFPGLAANFMNRVNNFAK